MDSTVEARIRQEITDSPVVLFMKGSPVFPQCGFSAAVVQILSHLGVKFKGVDVLADPSIRQGIKEFSEWPTIPQLYVKGEFVGGCDIIREMFETGELQQVLERKRRPGPRLGSRRRRPALGPSRATAESTQKPTIDPALIGRARGGSNPICRRSSILLL